MFHALALANNILNFQYAVGCRPICPRNSCLRSLSQPKIPPTRDFTDEEYITPARAVNSIQSFFIRVNYGAVEPSFGLQWTKTPEKWLF